MTKDIQRLSADVDRIIAEQGRLDSTPTDRNDAELLQLAQRLATTDLSGESVGREALRRRLLNEPIRRKSMFFRTSDRPARLRLMPIALAVLALALLLTPTGQSFAKSMLQRFGLVEISSEPTGAEKLATNGADAIDLAMDPAAPTAAPPVMSTAQVFVPGYLPEGYEAQAGYRGMHYTSGTDSISIYTRDPQLGPLAVGDATITPASIRGVEGVYVENAALYIKDNGRPMYNPEDFETVSVNLLMWEEDGQVVVVESWSLGQAELLRIAEGLTR